MRSAILSRLRACALITALGVGGGAGCAAPPPTRELARGAVDAMGGPDRLRAIRSLAMRNGAGTRWQLGQGVRATDPDTRGTLNAVTETIDLAGRRAALEYEISTADGFNQHRQEILTVDGDRPVGLERVAGRPLAVMSPAALFSWGTQNSPLLTLRRNIVDIALAGLSADASEIAQDRDLNGRRVKFGHTALKDETIGIYFDPASKLIAAYETMDTEAILGDVTARYVLEDYRSVGGIMLPHRITITKDGQRYASVHFDSIAVDDAESLRVFDVPPEALDAVADVAAATNDYSPMTLTAVADGVYFAQAYSHHSLVVEFPTYLAVVEAPYTEAQSKTLVGLLAMQFPGKPVRYVAVTHPHFDHIGGVRGMAAAGATILVAHAHEPPLRALLNARHTNPADDLETRRRTMRKVGTLQVFADTSKVITEGNQTLELRVITGSPHADPMVVAYIPSAHLLFESDLFFPGTGAAATPASTHLFQTIRRLKLDVTMIAGGHGGVGPFDELARAVTGEAPERTAPLASAPQASVRH
jgi:glyoxylase-like metal-dependent hydrolase (beta-lactamase superfamily II)